MKAAAISGLLIGLLAAVGAQAESRNGQSRYPELQGWSNPYSKGASRDDRVKVIRPPQTSVTGTPREPLGGGSWMDRSRGSRR